MREDTVSALIDALALLLVRLHLIGFYWGKTSPVEHALPSRRGRVRRPTWWTPKQASCTCFLTPASEYDVDLARYEHHRRTYGPSGWRLFHHGRRSIDVGDRIRTPVRPAVERVTAEEYFLPNDQRQVWSGAYPSPQRAGRRGPSCTWRPMMGEHLVIQPKWSTPAITTVSSCA